MSKYIFLMGSPAGGKTTWATGLGLMIQKKLKAKRTPVLIIYPDAVRLDMSVLMPDIRTDRGKSLSELIRNPSPGPDDVLRNVQTLKDYPSLGMLGFTTTDTPDSYPLYSREKASMILSACEKVAEYIIVDGSSDLWHDPFSEAALSRADVIGYCLSPTLSGLAYTHVMPLPERSGEENGKPRLVLKLFAEPRPDLYPLEEELGHVVGTPDGTLFYSPGLYADFANGKGFYSFTDRRTQISLSHISDQILEAFHD